MCTLFCKSAVSAARNGDRYMIRLMMVAFMISLFVLKSRTFWILARLQCCYGSATNVREFGANEAQI